MTPAPITYDELMAELESAFRIAERSRPEGSVTIQEIMGRLKIPEKTARRKMAALIKAGTWRKVDYIERGHAAVCYAPK